MTKARWRRGLDAAILVVAACFAAGLCFQMSRASSKMEWAAAQYEILIEQGSGMDITKLEQAWLSGDVCVTVCTARRDKETAKEQRARHEAEVKEQLEANPKTGHKPE